MSPSRRSAQGLLAAATAFLLPVAYSPNVHASFWSPKVAVLLVAGAAGAAELPRLVRSPLRPAALAAASFAVIVVLATLVSPSPIAATLGLYNWGTGALFLVSCVGLWSLGCSVPPEERELVLRALLAGVGLSAVVGVLQTFGAVPVHSLEAPGRSFGLAGNAVHLGALAAAAAAVGAHRAARSWWWLAIAAAGAVVVQLSGTRFALIVLVLATVAGAARGGRRWGVALLTVVALGLVAGSMLSTVGGGQSATGRSSDDGTSSVVAGGGSRVRLEVWSYAMHAVGRRPLLGSGPGRFRAATSADRTLTVAQYEGGDSVYADAHNIVVEHLVTTGVLGTLALAAWVLLAFRAGGGTLAWFAGALLLMSLVQPMSAGTTPLLFLALGTSGSIGPSVRRGAADVARAALLVAAVGSAGVLLVGDYRLEVARLDFHTADAETADSLLRPWPAPATIRARIAAFEALSGRGSAADAIRWRREALRRDPTDAGLAVLLAQEELGDGRFHAAEHDFQRALQRNPWSTVALGGLARLAERRGDDEAARSYARRALLVRPNRSLQRLIEPRADAKRPGP